MPKQMCSVIKAKSDPMKYYIVVDSYFAAFEPIMTALHCPG